MHQATRKSYGPFLLTKAAGPVPAEFFGLPWQDVKGGQVVISVSDDIDSNPAIIGSLASQLLIYSEVSIYGIIQGQQFLLKLACIDGKTGPFNLILPWEEGYERISFRARTMAGGKPLTPPFNASAAYAQAALANVNLSVFCFPRGGFQGVVNG